jgi:hypothetical protein
MAKDWKITHQKLGTALNEDGTGFTQQWNVGYMVTDGPAAGVRGEVHTTEAMPDPDRINDAIDLLVRNHHRIHSL